MSHWDSQQQRIIPWPTKPWKGARGWVSVDCGCAAGLEWGGEEPRECAACGGSGIQAYHKESHTYALYPGGPFRGRDMKAARIRAGEGA